VRLHETITVDRILDAVKCDESLGFCTNCGADADGVEPDARNYKCECCGQPWVFGAEELLLMTAI
jgi:hypothetical protein